MGVKQKLLSGLEYAIQEAVTIGYKRGGEDVLSEFSGHASSALRDGDNSVMHTYKRVKKELDEI